MALPEGVVGVMDDAGLKGLVARIRQLPPVTGVTNMEFTDLKEAALSGLLVVLVTLPVALPFLFMHEVGPALRVSNLVAVVMMFFSGYSLARASGIRPWLLGGLMVLIGVALVGMTMALGG
jgi:VIT1/CCC1 family predicted Fe2+/Mn2+ transporter